MHLLNLSLLILLLIPFSIALRNFFRFAVIAAEQAPARQIRVSVLVPARNEERGIEQCIRSILDQEYTSYEVIVLDDGSEDGTKAILQQIAATDPRLQVISGAPLSDGWTGKNWACHQLAARATGELLIFTDADTIHAPPSVRACAGFAQQSRCDLFSGVPRQRMVGFWERVLVPMAQFLYVAFLPNEWITEKSDPKFSATNGQLLCVTRDAYRRIGGHHAVRGNVLDDVEIGRAAKRAGLRTALAVAVEIVECRMYRSLREIIAGFSKNLYPGLGAHPAGLVAFVMVMFLLFTFPLIALLIAITTADWSIGGFLLPLTSLILGAGIRLMIAIRFAMRWDQIFYQPLAAAAGALIALNSARLHYSKQGALWKGRRVR